jgi:cobalt-zinc-cadmium efflux system membrane fusion protein
MKNTTKILAACVALGVGLMCAGCRKSAANDPGAGASSTKVGPQEVVITAGQQAAQKIEVQTATLENIPSMVSVPGKITLPDNAMWRVGVLTSGRVEAVYANLGDAVKKGQILARMHSHDVHEARADYEVAVAERTRHDAAAALAQKEYERTMRLFALKAASLEQTEIAKQELVNAQTAARDAEVNLVREKTHLEEILGIPADVPAGASEEEMDTIPIRAPASGYVLEKNVTPGSTIEPATDAFVLGDLHHLWMLASVEEGRLAELHQGEAATVTLPDVPGVSFNGRVTNLGQQFDPTTRRMQIRIELDNPENRLRPEMLAQASLPVGERKAGLFVSQDAVQQINGLNTVFVRTGGDHFAMRPVETGQVVPGMVEILSGVTPGEQVVTHGSFLVKSELLRASIGD